MDLSENKISGINIVFIGNIEVIKLNRPNKKNALSSEMIIEIPKLLAEADINENVELVVFTGEGEYFTSGNDLSNFMNDKNRSSVNDDLQTMDEKLEYGKNMFHRFVKSFIDFRKPLFAVVNGPTIGIGVTILGIFDYVFASDMATFHCPFVTLGQTPEGCSTFVFPKLMGNSKASQVLLFGKKLNAMEAYERNLVTEVVCHQELGKVWTKIKRFASLPPNTLMNGKEIIKRWTRLDLHKANDMECELLIKQWQSEEFMDAIITFLSKKSSKL